MMQQNHFPKDSLQGMLKDKSGAQVWNGTILEPLLCTFMHQWLSGSHGESPHFKWDPAWLDGHMGGQPDSETFPASAAVAEVRSPVHP